MTADWPWRWCAVRRTASLDGFAYNKYGWRGAHGWPGFAAGDDPSGRDDLKAKDEVRRRVCTIKRDECFAAAVDPEGGTTLASEVFKHIAFREVKCGDCGKFPPPSLLLFTQKRGDGR